MFIIEKTLELVKKTEMKIAIKKTHKQPQKYSVQKILENEKNKVLKNKNNNSDFD